MKYSKKIYESTEFYGSDEDTQYETQKVVKVRKDHECCNCGETIKIGENALYETCFLDGPKQCYTCITCCDKWLDEIMGDEEATNCEPCK